MRKEQLLVTLLCLGTVFSAPRIRSKFGKKSLDCEDQCPENWRKYQNKCFLSEETGKTFDEVKEYCASLNATMAVIHSEEENAFVASIVTPGTWTYLGGKTTGPSAKEFEWFDASPADFHNWEPSTLEPNQAIVIRQDGKWSISELPDTHPVLCEQSLKKCVPEAEARIKKTETVVNSLEGGISRILKHFSTNQKTLKTEVSSINNKLNSTEENIEALHESSYGLQKQIDIIVSYLSRFSHALQELAGLESR